MSVLNQDSIKEIYSEIRLMGIRYAGMLNKVHQLSNVLKEEKAKEYLSHGVGRRITVLNRCIENVFTFFPPDQQTPLEADKVKDVDINLHAFCVNIFGLLDNLAWVWVYERQLSPKINEHNVGLFKEKVKSSLPKAFQEYLDSDLIKKWHHKYQKDYRNAVSHKIPLYVPPKTLHSEQIVQYQNIENKINGCYKAFTLGNSGDRITEIEKLRTEQEAVGSACPLFVHSFTESEGQLFIHPQMIADFKTIEEIVGKFCEAVQSGEIKQEEGQTDEEKFKFLAEHFFYEIQQLLVAVYVVKHPLPFWINIKLEVFLLHARSLYEFFYSKEKRNDDDARAYDFIVDVNKWVRERPLKSNDIEQSIKRMNKELSHITYKRHSGVVPEKQWELVTIKDHLLAVIKVFLDNVPNGSKIMDEINKFEVMLIKKFRGRGLISFDDMKKSETIEFKKSTAEVKAGVVSIAAMLNIWNSGTLDVTCRKLKGHDT